jgi:hypothetical protein
LGRGRFNAERNSHRDGGRKKPYLGLTQESLQGYPEELTLTIAGRKMGALEGSRTYTGGSAGFKDQEFDDPGQPQTVEKRPRT